MAQTLSFTQTIKDWSNPVRYYHDIAEFKDDLRHLGTTLLGLEDISLVPLNADNKAQNQLLIDQEKSVVITNDDPIFPITLVLKNGGESVIALIQVGPKKSGETFSTENLTGLKDLIRYAEVQCQNLLEKQDLAAALTLQTKQFNIAQHELEQLNRLREDFLSIASHELRTPMSVIRGYSDFLLSGDFGPINDQQENFLKKILTNVDQLTQLINNMLDMSKLEAGKMKFNFTDTSLLKLVEEVVSDHQILFTAKDLRLSLQVEEKNDTSVRVDTEKFTMALSNLISNAYKFSPAQGEVIVHINKDKEAENWVIRVIDNGIGIPESQKDRLFEKFQQIDNSLQKKHAGTGLGLCITKRIVNRLGGQIWVEDNTPNGSIFSFTIPT